MKSAGGGGGWNRYRREDTYTSRQHIVRGCTENINNASSRIWLYFIDAMF